jgi:two-component system, OmpR family, sensor kinase
VRDPTSRGRPSQPSRPGRLGRLPLRIRLVAGFAAAMLVLLTAAGAFVYWRVQFALDRNLDGELSSATRVVAPLVGPDGRVAPARTADATGTGWQVLGASGGVLDAGGSVPSRPLVSAEGLSRAAQSPDGTVEVGTVLPVSDRPYRVRVTALPTDDGPATYLAVAVRRDNRDEALRELLLQLTLAGLGALVVASLVGDALARAALRPVEAYRGRAEEIAAGASGLRLDVPGERDDEVTRLGHTLNRMLAAQQASLERERQFVDDASHELRTPLTLLRSRLQLTRRRPRSTQEHEAVLGELAVDVDRLVDLAEQLLVLSRAGQGGTSRGDLAAAVTTVLARYGPGGPEVVSGTTAAGPLPVPVEGSALERVVTNLLTNAVRHGRSPVVVRTRREDDSAGRGVAVLEVSDAGDGMTPDLLESATRRFHRAPEARARAGTGLGLAIVEALVGAADGELRLCSGGHHVAHGTPSGLVCDHTRAMTVTVVLPLAAG